MDTLVCKKCKSWELTYWDNVLLLGSFDWGYYCETCKKNIDPYEDVEVIEDECRNQ